MNSKLSESTQWNFQRRKQTNSMLVQKITTFIKEIFTPQTREISNNGEPFQITKPLLLKYLCIQVNQWVTARETLEFSQICLSWCSQLQWTGLWNFGILKTSREIPQFTHSRAVKNIFMMCNGLQFIHLSSLQLTAMALLIFGTLIKILRVLSFERRLMNKQLKEQGTENLMIQKLLVA